MPPDITHQKEFIPAVSPLPELVKNDPKIAFGRVVMPYFLRLNEEDYVGITDQMMEAAAPARLRPFLFRAEGDHSVNGITLSSAEYANMVRYPNAFGRAVNTYEYERRRLDPDTDRRRLEANEEEVRNLELRLPRMQGILNGVLLEKQRVALLAKEAKSPGYAHVSARVMREAVIYTRDYTFKRILDVVGREKDWTNEQADLARRSVDARLFFSGAKRVGNFQSMLGLADEYGRRRERLFGTIITKIQRRLGEVATRTQR